MVKCIDLGKYEIVVRPLESVSAGDPPVRYRNVKRMSLAL